MNDPTHVMSDFWVAPDPNTGKILFISARTGSANSSPPGVFNCSQISVTARWAVALPGKFSIVSQLS
ncbi:MAG: hypothetical protein IT580_23015 [Verrucomicrobiales bacterium]|nr:hypothetical protein [Verrucomicrobiales bacterium]